MINSSDLPPFVFRKAELEKICTLLTQDRDLVVTGVPGIGRRTLVRNAAHQVGIRHFEIDCLRCRSAEQFVQLLIDGINIAFSGANELAEIRRWASQALGPSPAVVDRLVWSTAPGKEWEAFEQLLSLPQYLAEAFDCRTVIVFHNLGHIRAWDRHRKWEARLLQVVKQQTRVSYVLIAVVPEAWMNELPVISLGPLDDRDMHAWIVDEMLSVGLRFDSDKSLETFLSYAQGHIKDAMSLAHRVQSTCLVALPRALAKTRGEIEAHHVHSSMHALVKDIEVTFETLLLLLPPTQAKLLESLSLDPTDRPQASAYIKKHHLSRGGSLQGALSSLEQKGLVYGAQLGFRVALPLFDFWIKRG